MDERAEAAGELQSLYRLLVVVENYPQLKADAQFRPSWTSWQAPRTDLAAGVEGSTGSELQRQGQAVPMVLFARIAGFSERAYFEVSPDAMTVPDVQF